MARPVQTSARHPLVRFTAAVLVGACLAGSLAAPARAAKLEIVFKDGLWGLAIGALLGTAQVLSYKNPDNEYYRITTGAALGAVIGVAFGIAEVSGAFATYDRERGQLAIGVPALQYSQDEHGAKVMADVIRVRF